MNGLCLPPVRATSKVNCSSGAMATDGLLRVAFQSTPQLAADTTAFLGVGSHDTLNAFPNSAALFALLVPKFSFNTIEFVPRCEEDGIFKSHSNLRFRRCAPALRPETPPAITPSHSYPNQEICKQRKCSGPKHYRQNHPQPAVPDNRSLNQGRETEGPW